MRIKKRLIIFLMLAVLSVMTPSDAGALSEQDSYSEFRSANEAFREANLSSADAEAAQKLYTEAILHYEKIIEAGAIKNAKLYYNLANAYLLKDVLGKAILNYRRAQKLEPSNGDIHKNLAFARSRRIDKVQIKTRKRVLQTLFFWHYDLSIKSRLFLSCLFFALVCTGLTVMLWFGRRGYLTSSCVISAILMVCFTASVAVESVYAQSHLCGVIIAPSVVARQGDGPNYPVSFKEPLHAGTEFELIKQHPGWLHILLADGSDGWIPDHTAEFL